jgi:hypothetical protein
MNSSSHSHLSHVPSSSPSSMRLASASDHPFSPPHSSHPPPSPSPSLNSPSFSDLKSSRLSRSSSGPSLFASDLLSQPLTKSRNKASRTINPSASLNFSLNSTLATVNDNVQNAKNFKVCVRIRPPLPKEIEFDGVEQYQDCTRVHAMNSAVTLSEAALTNTANQSIDNSLLPSHTFTFDRVFDQDAQQEEVYMETTKSAVLAVLEGYNAVSETVKSLLAIVNELLTN